MLQTGRRFCLCGASFVLDFQHQHVAGVDGRETLLDSAQPVVLPRAAAAESKKAWGNCWLGKGHSL